MPTLSLPGGELRYRFAGPDFAEGPPVVFVHGFLVDSTVWSRLAERLAADGVRSYLPDLPLGSHRLPLDHGADQTLRGVVRRIIAFLEALDLRDVTLVGNDTGGALCQILVDTDHSRIGRLVLTNCDAFKRFPPAVFVPAFALMRSPRRMRIALTTMRPRVLRHSPLGFGLLLKPPRDASLTRGWVQPALDDPRVRDDAARFLRNLDRKALLDVAPRLRTFGKPVRMVWGTADRCFKLSDAYRLAEAFGGDAQVVEVPGATTFVGHDRPGEVAAAIVDLARQPR